MKFSILVLSSPYSSQSHLSALKFAQTCIEQQHQIYRIFFYHDGVHGGSELQAPPQDEPNIAKQWQELAQSHDIDLVTCIAAALKRGILNQEEAARYTKEHYNLAQKFDLSGLGQLLDAQIHSDRVITFG